MSRSGHIVLGVDLGKVTTSIALGQVGRPGCDRAFAARHSGRPLQPLLELYRGLERGSIAGIVATGLYSARLGGPVLSGLPEESAQEEATRLLYPGSEALNVVRIGGAGFSVLARDEQGTYRYERNDRCSAGTGETMERICARLGATLEEAVALADQAAASIPLTARCSVFAKSEVTHFANQGEAHGPLFRGYFDSVAKNIAGLVERDGVRGRVVLIGHGALVGPVADAVAESLGREVEVSAHAGVFEALGALEWARRGWAGATMPVPDQPKRPAWPQDPEELVVAPTRHIRPLAVGSEVGGRGEVIRIADPACGSLDHGPVVLGLDLGSTGSKAALLDVAGGSVVADVYRRTDGNPVEAARSLVQQILDQAPRPVVAVGLTGSGRDAAATVFRALLEGNEYRLLVQNEIVAHATAAMRYDPDEGRSLSIVEIGGQDAKFINVKNGSILESDMNRACSAGTGSFLEEQAVLHGVDDIVRFGEMAGQATRAPDLGQMCTVFVAELAADALTAGYSREDVFAGFQYSVIRNYRNRVMGNRQFLDHIFFQGKPASSPSLARALASVTGRTVYVPPNPGAMGAIGIAMMARAALDDGAARTPLDLSGLLTAEVVGRRTFHCRDRECHNLCRIESAEVRLGRETRRVVSGGNCPKYEAVAAGGPKLPKDVPNPYREREAVLRRMMQEDRALASAGGLAGGARDEGRVVLPLVHHMHDVLPFFHGLLSALGVPVVVAKPDGSALAVGDRLCRAASVCAPVKLAHGIAAQALDGAAAGPASAGATLVMPKLIRLPSQIPGSGRATCPLAQGAPELVDTALRASGGGGAVARPVLLEAQNGWGSRLFAREVARVWRSLPAVAGGGRPREEMREALAYAAERQRSYEAELEGIGRRTLAFAAERSLPVVLVVGETHILHDAVVNPGIEELISANGAVALPVDCYPLPTTAPPLARVHWAGGSRSLQAALDGACRGGVYPLLLGAYGCGPGSFVEHMFNDLLAGYPHTILESDGHSGRAGYITRVQAFLHSVREHEARRGGREAGRDGSISTGSKRPAPPIDRYDCFPVRTFQEFLDRKVVFGTVGGGLGRQMAAVLRGFGVDAVFSGQTDAAAMRRAQEGCTGKECIPYQLVWGSFAEFLTRQEPSFFSCHARRPLLLSVGLGFQDCRANVFHLAEEMAAERLGLPGAVEVSDLTIIMRYAPLTALAWAAAVSVDLLNALRFYHHSCEAQPGAADRLGDGFEDGLEKLLEHPLGERHWPEVGPTLQRMHHLLRRAAAAYAGLARRPGAAEQVRDVYVCGDVFLRVNEWGNDNLQRRLSNLGLRVTCEPFSELFELLALRETQDHPPGSREWAKHHLYLQVMAGIRDRLVSAIKPLHPWVDWFDIRAVDAESRRLLEDGYPFGESIATVGGALLAWRRRPVDGVVVVGPRGCGPAIIAEAQLRHEPDIPLLFVYNDGDPVDEARLAGFAWRLRGAPSRSRRSSA